jgi:predicted enzyme related to lactoylglutathione lyase
MCAAHLKEKTMSAHFVLLHVNQPTASAAFYSKLLQREPVESSPTFAMFALADGLMLGLWLRPNVEPKSGGAPGSSELCFVAKDDADVEANHQRWKSQGVEILQAPTRMDFGYTFTGADPDGHRLRVFAPAG